MAVTEAHARTAPASKRAEPRAVSPTLVAASRVLEAQTTVAHVKDHEVLIRDVK